MTKRAILYARVSGDDRKYATSGIESQLADCRRYAAERGYQVVNEVYETPDKVTSGADWLPELDRVLKLAQGGTFDVLVVREIDRLARNRFKQMSVEIQLEAYGARVEYVIGQFEESAEGRLLKGLMSEFAEYEREKIKERTTRGALRSVTAGNVTIGGSYAPYGYDLATVNGRRVLVVNETEAATVRLIFDLYANQGYSLYGVRDYLDAHHVPKPAKGNNHKARSKPSSAMWSIGTLNGILDNECYVGRWHYRKTKQVKDLTTGKHKSIARPREEWLLVNVPAIVPVADFEAAQAQRTENKRIKGHYRKYDYLLGGMLKCGHCGNSVSGMTKVHKGIGYGYYKCNAHHLPKKYGFKCDNAQYKVKAVDLAVWEYVKAVYTSPDMLNEALANYQAQQADAQRPQLDMIEATAARLADAEHEKARLVKAYASGVLTLDEIATTKTELDRRLNDLTQALAMLRAELPAAVLTTEDIDRIKSDAAELRQGMELSDNNPTIQRRILERLLVECRLVCVEGKRYVDVDSILGPARLPADYTTTGCSDSASTQSASSRGCRRCTVP
jgi:site-specific DNA recombinase